MLKEKCVECERVFDLTDEEDAAEWADGHDCEPEPQDLYQLLEDATGYLEPIADLYRWSTNYDYQTGTPWFEFLDLIGYSDEHYGQKTNYQSFTLDYASTSSFGAAIDAWGSRPNDVIEFIEKIHAAE